VLVAVAIYTAVGLASVWVARSTRHWFLRTAVVAAALSPALAVEGSDVVLAFSVQAAVAVLGIKLVVAWRAFVKRAGIDRTSRGHFARTFIAALAKRPWRAEAAPNADDTQPEKLPLGRRRFQFSMLDLMLAVVVVAAIASVVVRVPSYIWAAWRAIGMAGLMLGGFTVASWVGLTSFTTHRRRCRKEPTSVKRLRVLAVLTLTLLYVVSLLVGFPFAVTCHRLINPTPLPPIVLPEPNGYNDLIRAGRQLDNATIPDATTATPAELAAFLGRYGHVLDTARIGLDRECRVPLSYSPADLNRTDDGLLRGLGWAFLVEGKLAEVEKRTDDAITSYLDLLRLSQAAATGGCGIDASFGWGLEGMGVAGLARIGDTVTSNQADGLIDALRAFERSREPLEDILARDLLVTEYAWGKTGRVMDSVVFYALLRGVGVQIERSLTRDQAKTRLLICELAIRRYRLDHGSDPNTLEELVPDYLPAVPRDPFAAGPLKYRPDGSGHRLWSVGPDGRNDGAEPMGEESNASPGDLLLIEPEEAADQPSP
jgi:hypothetical protein